MSGQELQVELQTASCSIFVALILSQLQSPHARCVGVALPKCDSAPRTPLGIIFVFQIVTAGRATPEKDVKDKAHKRQTCTAQKPSACWMSVTFERQHNDDTQNQAHDACDVPTSQVSKLAPYDYSLLFVHCIVKCNSRTSITPRAAAQQGSLIDLNWKN